MKIMLIFVAAASLYTASAAKADSIVQTTILDLLANSISDVGIEHYPPIAAYLFNPALGTLNSVSYEYKGTLSGSFSGEFNNYPLPTQGYYGGTISIGLFGYYPLVSATASEAAFALVSGSSLTVTALSGAQFDVSGTIPINSFVAISMPDALVLDLVDAPAGAISNFSLNNIDCDCALPFFNDYGSEIITTHATFTLTYGYTPLPEPQTLAMFCCALLGLWSIRRLSV